MLQLRSAVSCPSAMHCSEEPGSIFSITSSRNWWTTSSSCCITFSLCWTRPIPSASLHLPCASSTASKLYINVCPVFGDPKLDTLLQGQPYNCWAEGHNHIPLPPCHTSVTIAQHAVSCCLHCQGTLLTYMQFLFYQAHKVLFCQAVPWPVLFQGRVSPQVWDLVFVLAIFHKAPAGPSIQPV